MSEYIKHTWKDDETITKEKLNNMEDGIAEAIKLAKAAAESGAAVSTYNGEVEVS